MYVSKAHSLMDHRERYIQSVRSHGGSSLSGSSYNSIIDTLLGSLPNRFSSSSNLSGSIGEVTDLLSESSITISEKEDSTISSRLGSLGEVFTSSVFTHGSIFSLGEVSSSSTQGYISSYTPSHLDNVVLQTRSLGELSSTSSIPPLIYSSASPPSISESSVTIHAEEYSTPKEIGRSRALISPKSVLSETLSSQASLLPSGLLPKTPSSEETKKEQATQVRDIQMIKEIPFKLTIMEVKEEATKSVETDVVEQKEEECLAVYELAHNTVQTRPVLTEDVAIAANASQMLSCETIPLATANPPIAEETSSVDWETKYYQLLKENAMYKQKEVIYTQKLCQFEEIIRNMKMLSMPVSSMQEGQVPDELLNMDEVVKAFEEAYCEKLGMKSSSTRQLKNQFLETVRAMNSELKNMRWENKKLMYENQAHRSQIASYGDTIERLRVDHKREMERVTTKLLSTNLENTKEISGIMNKNSRLERLEDNIMIHRDDLRWAGVERRLFRLKRDDSTSTTCSLHSLSGANWETGYDWLRERWS